MLLTVYQGRNVYNKTSQFFTTDKEWARNFTQSGQDSEIRIGKIDPKVIYQKEPMPEATDEKQIDVALEEAKAGGYSAIWINEGRNEPPAILVIDMKVVKIHKQSMIRESEDIKQLRDETEKFRLSLIKKYPQLQELYFGIQVGNVLHISSIKIKLEDRHQGVGSNVIGEIKKFAKDHKLVITLSREPERGHKKNLERFYKNLGFLDNKGRNKDYRYASFFGPTMYHKPHINEGFELESDIDKKCEILAKFIASFFWPYFEKKLSDVSNTSNDTIVKYSEYYRLAKQYKKEGSLFFNVLINSKETKWGISDFKITSKDKTMPDVILKIVNGDNNEADSSGYVEQIENPKEIFIRVDKISFTHLFKKSTEELTDTIKHEIRHWVQFTKIIGLPKEKIINKNADVLGYTSYKGLKSRESHHMRDIEFKTNVHTYAFYIKRYLNKNYEKPMWQRRFKSIANGIVVYTGDKSIDMIIDNLNNMKKRDIPRWKQFVKEIYKLVFND